MMRPNMRALILAASLAAVQLPQAGSPQPALAPVEVVSPAARACESTRYGRQLRGNPADRDVSASLRERLARVQSDAASGAVDKLLDLARCEASLHHFRDAVESLHHAADILKRDMPGSATAAKTATTRPTAAARVQPAYPASAREREITGVVLVHAAVSASGTVTDAHVVASIDELDKAAIDAVRQWRFTPATAAGRDVTGAAIVAVVFGSPSTDFAIRTFIDLARVHALRQEADDALKAIAAAAKALDSEIGRLDELAREFGPLVEMAGDVDPDVVQPRPLTTPKPVYTTDAMQRNLTGSVIVEVLVDRNGRVAWVRVLRALDPSLDASALDAAKRWTFTPGTAHGEPVAMLVQMEMTFTIRIRP